ncbi:hypothetical protein O0L34_g15137 [Tuta absoluta]|nr:hypothetical protein O0L34_g15137 [Tuta absoluta]
MSRRFLFVVAVFVVMLYFSIILFMLSPLHSRRFAYSSFPYQQAPNVEWCKPLRWRTPPGDPVALVSYPGSGNTWLRYLLQQATGIVTGSIYMDHGLRLHGFPAENVSDGSVLVVKTHEAPPLEPDKFKSAILLIRNPRDAILADFNRIHMGHIGTAPKSAFMKKIQEKPSKEKPMKKLEWDSYVFSRLSGWESLNAMWLRRFRGPVMVVFYETLVRDTQRVLATVLGFLHYNYTEMDVTCALANREGIYRRRKKHKDFDPFTPDMYRALNTVKNRLLVLVNEYRSKHNQTNRQVA